MKLSSLCANGQLQNIIFQLDHPTNRDNCYYPYHLLKKQFYEAGIEINTADVNAGREVDFELHQDVQKNGRNCPAYVLLLESPVIRPDDQRHDNLSKYRIVFTWNDDLIDNRRYIKINTPIHIMGNDSRGWKERDLFCCMIAGNKAAGKPSPLELYSERVNTIRWFERNAPQDFDLFGPGWDAPAARTGIPGKVANGLQHLLRGKVARIYFPSYRGIAPCKNVVLQKYRFSICYENARDFPGYITEKIFDSYFAGCVPVYWGASNISSHIPDTCFIDRRKFTSHETLYEYLVSMTESEYIDFQEHIALFLKSDGAIPFSSEVFAKTIVETIVRDLGITA